MISTIWSQERYERVASAIRLMEARMAAPIDCDIFSRRQMTFMTTRRLELQKRISDLTWR